MLLVDDIVLFPMKSVLWIFDEIYHAAEEALESEADAVTAQLQELYRMLESGSITDTEFDAREAELLDRLEAMQE